MVQTKNHILTINGGSSSIRFAVFEADGQLETLFSGKLENVGSRNTKAVFSDSLTNEKESLDLESNDFTHATDFLVDWLENQRVFESVIAVGHRIVHGMQHTQTQEITSQLIQNLKEISPYDPEHLPEEIKLIEAIKTRYPSLMQIACFDTSFHSNMPAIAKMLPIPRSYAARGIHRYGFHGLSYAYLTQELEELTDEGPAGSKVILAHLGSGASLAAVRNGQSIDTSMGFTPASGLVMGSRSGDLDPGVAWYMMQFEKLNAVEFNHLINHQSGLLGVSETSADMRKLIESQDTDKRAAEAVELFCYQVKKWIGSFAAVLEGVDTLVFSGGIGENIPQVRTRICEGLGFLGITIDENQNQQNKGIISTDAGRVTVRVMKTNEELMIARLVNQFLIQSN